MPIRVGAGRREAAILAALDGQPREVRELASEITGHEPTKSELVSLSRAAHNLAAHGMLQLTHVPRGTGGGAGPPRVFVLKVGAWVQDGDSCTGTDSQRYPVGSPGWLAAAWAAFGTDICYAEEIAAAARKCMTQAEREQLQGAQRVGDADTGSAAEARHPCLGVADVGR